MWLGQGIRLVALALPVVLLALHEIDSADLWFHLAAGRVVLEQGGPPRVDPFGPEPVPWVNPAWLAGVLFHLLYTWGGARALVLFTTAVTSLALLLPLGLEVRQAASRRRSRAPFEWAYLLALWIAYERFFVDPEILSILCAVFVSQVLLRGGPRRVSTLLVLVLVQVFWANVHAAFVLGPLFAVLVLVGQTIDLRKPPSNTDARPPWMTFGLPLFLTGASGLTPYGFDLVGHVIASWGVLGSPAFRTGIAEWQPTFAAPVLGDLVLMTFVASLVFLLASAWTHRRGLRAFDLLLVLTMTVLAISSRRLLLLYAVTALPVGAGWLASAAALRASEQPPRPGPRVWTRTLRVGASLLAPALALLLAYDVASGRFYRRFGPPRRTGLGISAFDHPIGAADFVQKHGLEGPIFNNVAAGSYLVGRFRGDPPVFIDGRLLDPERFRTYRTLLSSMPVFDGYAARHGFRFAVFALQPHPPLRVFRHLYASPLWTLTYLDGEGAVFVHANVLQEKPHLVPMRLESPLPEIATRSPRRPWRVCDPGETLVRGKVLLRLGFPKAARRDLANALLTCTERWEIGLELSSALIALGDSQEAFPLVERVLRHDPGNARAWVNLGTCFFDSGDKNGARLAWERALVVRPPDPRAHQLLKTLDE